MKALSQGRIYEKAPDKSETSPGEVPAQQDHPRPGCKYRSNIIALPLAQEVLVTDTAEASKRSAA